MSIKLEVGKYYCTRDGRKVGPARKDDNDRRLPWCIPSGSGEHWYDNDGVSCILMSADIIAEWAAQPATPNKYARTINGATVDVYDILRAFNVTCPATQHAVKKLLMPGQRGGKSVTQDLREALASVQRAIDMAGE